MAKYYKKTSNYQTLVINTVREKYPYLLLGLTVLLIAYLVISSFLSKKQLFQVNNNKETAASTTTTSTTSKTEETKKYVVKEGDDLWHIAQATYGSGYNAYDVAKANNIANPSIIEAGQELILPSLTPKQPTTGEVVEANTSQVTITGAQYTVQHGDYLWKIAQDSYGDGFSWVRIAQANNLANPDIIFAGNVLLIPR